MKTSDYTEFTVSVTPRAFVLVCKEKERDSVLKARYFLKTPWIGD